jgi:hypothetical protein
MTKEREDAQSSKSGGSLWPAVVKTGAAIAAIGGVAFHFMGLVGHIAYLRNWGIDAGLFPKPVDWLMVNGATAVADRTVVVLAAMETSLGKLLLLALLFFVLFSIAFRFGIASAQRAPQIPKSSATRDTTSPWWRSVGFGVMVTTSMFGAVPIAMLFVAVLILFPAVMGDTYGATVAQRERKVFDGGCQAAGHVAQCVEVRKGDQLLVRGFLIESSQTHVALYDPATHRARAIPREGTDLLADPLPALNDRRSVEAPK